MSNYRICGSSHIGKSHEVDNTVCQDSHFFQEGNGFIVAAVADGLGTSLYSDVASKMAASTAVEYCINNINMDMSEEQILSGIKNAFAHANNLIKMKAGSDIDDYDTTLSLAVFSEGDLFYGHAGDSGILALCTDGTFQEVTTQQLGEGEGKDRPVYPLINEAHWVFDVFDKPVHAVFLMTDGVLNMTVPPILFDQRYQLDHSYLIYLYEETRDGDDISGWINDELVQMSPGMVNYDDKTLIVVIDTSVALTFQPDEYYEFPSDTLYKSLLSQKPAVAAVAPQSFYEKVMGITSKELWKKNRLMISLIASSVALVLIATPFFVTFLRGTYDPVTGEWRRATFGEVIGGTLNPGSRAAPEPEQNPDNYIRGGDGFDPDEHDLVDDFIDGIEDIDEMAETMKDALKKVHTALVTTAARNSVFDGQKIKKGSHLALIDDSLTASSSDFDSVISAVSVALSEYKPEFITIFTGEDAESKEMDSVSGFLGSDSPEAEITVIDGGQPVYRYIISAE